MSISTARVAKSKTRITDEAKGWPRVSLGDVAEYINGRAFKPEEWSKSGLPIIRIKNLTDRSAPFDYFAGDTAPGHRVDSGDLLVSWSASLDAFIWDRGPAVVNQHIFKVVEDVSRIIKPYLYFALRSAMAEIDMMVHGATMKHVTKPVFEAFKISLPPLTEQERIATRLTEQLAAVESARAATMARVAAAEALTAAYYREAFGQDPPFSASPLPPQEPTRANWRWHLLTNLARLATGHTPSRREVSYWGGDIPWLQLPDIRAVDGRRIFETSESTNLLGIENSSSVLLPENTVCMSRTASVGFVTIMGRPMATSQDFVNWICGPDLDPDFLMRALIRSRDEIRDLGSGATHHSIYFQTVLAFNVCVPEIKEQRRIAGGLSRRLTETERIISLLRQELAEIEALPNALLRAAFNGVA